MHEVDPACIPPQVIGIDLAKSIRIEALIQPFHGLVNFFLLGGDPALGIE
jgi:hypothetical protein